MSDSIPKIPVMAYNQLKNEAIKDLMDILKGRENIPLKPTEKIQNESNKKTVTVQGNEESKISHTSSSPNKDVLIRTLKQILEGYQLNEQDVFFLKADHISQELKEQYDSSIKFKGVFFNFLRHVLQQHSGSKSIEKAVVDVLRDYVTLTTKTNLQDNLLKNLNQLVERLTQKSEVTLSQVNEIKQLIQKQDIELKNLMPILKEVTMQNAKDGEMMSMITKINDTINKLQDIEQKDASLNKALKQLLDQLPDSKLAHRYKEFNQKFEQLFDLQENLKIEGTETQPKTGVDKLIVMLIKAGTTPESKTDIESNLAKALVMNKRDEQEDSASLKLGNRQFNKEDTIETLETKNILEKILLKISDKSKALPDNKDRHTITQAFLKGIASTQSTKQPLLHFLLPIRFENTQAMGEIWIDPNEQKEDGSSHKKKSSTHMLLILNVEHVGNFELEILLDGKIVDIKLYCPSEVIEQFSDSEIQIPQIVEKAGLNLNGFEVTMAKKNRQLEEIFPDSFEKRKGINVKA